jgi:hypothetical protein
MMKRFVRITRFICSELLEVLFCATLLLGIIAIVHCFGHRLVLAAVVVAVFAVAMLVAYFAVVAVVKRKGR